VTVAAIDAHGADVMRMAERDRLRSRNRLPCSVRRICAEFKRGTAKTGYQNQNNDDTGLGKRVGTLGKDLSHSSIQLLRCFALGGNELFIMPYFAPTPKFTFKNLTALDRRDL
jgi:hypothetical protein